MAPTTSWWPFPPDTRELQFDEKWSFVAKKQSNCDPDDPDDVNRGDAWDFVAYDLKSFFPRRSSLLLPRMLEK